MTEPAGRARLIDLMSRVGAGEISCAAFCRAFEHAYNFEIGKADLTAEEERIFSALFDVVAWFTPEEPARKELPTHFKDEVAVRAAVERARRALAQTRGRP